MNQPRKLRFAHIINPVIVGPESDLHIAQPITFQSMLISRDRAQQLADVELYSAHYEEDDAIVPPFMQKTPYLVRSMKDLGQFKKPKKLPLLKDILDRLYEASSADYMIYTNVDIALMPNFYSMLTVFVNSGVDAMVINRRTISDRFTRLEEIAMMFAQAGQPHYGYDCFVFKREAYPKYDLGNICIGAAAIGSALLLNLLCFADRFIEFRDLHLTFHVGNTEVWRNPDVDDAQRFNQQQYEHIGERLGLSFDLGKVPVIGQQPINDYFDKLKKNKPGNIEI